MDARNDDSSGGSDSLDKSLQLKCVVDDVGQGEGKQADNIVTEVATTTSNPMQNSEHKKDQNHRSQHKKTEKSIGDGGGNEGGGSSAVATVEALNKCVCNENSIATTTTNVENSGTTAILNRIDSNCSSSSNNNNNNAFESKVKQISKDLKETSLAEYNATNETCSASKSSSSSTSSESCTSSATIAAADQQEHCGQLNISDSADDTRSKKVRFHPDVKENDGGNRVIPKKKKKLKGNASEEAGTTGDSSQCSTGTEDDMDYEEDEAAEEEEEFNLAKTIVEAQNYLKLHPLTFVRANNFKSGTNMAEETGKRLHNGLLQEEDLPLLSESSEEEDCYEEITPECGVERILGKQVRNGNSLLLVRYVNDDGLYWECEERIATMCPTMMSKYEINRERRQERLMRHVAKRQNLRQRYTDF